MSTILNSIGDIIVNAFGGTTSANVTITTANSWAGKGVSFITGNPLVLMFCLIGLVGIGIGLVKRAIN